MFNDNNKIKTILIAAWIAVSALYVSYDFVVYVKNTVIGISYNKGVSDGVSNTVTALIKESVNKEFSAFPVYLGENTVDLVNLKCLPADLQENLKKKKKELSE